MKNKFVYMKLYINSKVNLCSSIPGILFCKINLKFNTSKHIIIKIYTSRGSNISIAKRFKVNRAIVYKIEKLTAILNDLGEKEPAKEKFNFWSLRINWHP